MGQTIRVALLSTAVQFGGIDRVVANLVRYVDSGVEFLPILFTRTDTTTHVLFDTLDKLNTPYDKVFINAGTSHRLAPLRDARETIACIRSKRVDLIHSHGYRADVLGFFAAKRLGLPIMATCHGYVSSDRRLELYNRLDLLALRYFDRVVAVSDSLKADLIAHGIHERRVQTVLNAVGDTTPVDSQRIRRETRLDVGLSEDEFVFGFVGRLGPEKGLPDLLDALLRLRGCNDNISLLVVGDGPERERLQKLSVGSGLGTKVVFAGFQEEPASWYSAMDAFVLPSLTEGTPLVLLEAMSHGLPVIATSVGGVPAVLTDAENGLLVPPADSSRLSGAMQALVTNCQLRATLAEGARRTVREKFDVHSWAREMREVYYTVLAERGPTKTARG